MVSAILRKFRLFVGFVPFMLVSCGGGGGGGGGSPPTSALYIADALNNAIGTFAKSFPSGPTDDITNVIQGPSTQLDALTGGIFLDIPHNRLYVAKGSKILVFDSANTADGDVAPTRVITSASFNTVSSLFLDTTSDTLYVADTLQQAVWIFDNNAGSLSGSVMPTRSLTGLGQVGSVFVDTTRNLIYVSMGDASTGQISVYPSNTPGGNAVAASSQFSDNTGLVAPTAMWVDTARNELYVITQFQVLVYANASAATGQVAHTRAINTFTGNPMLTSVLYDGVHDRLYVLTTRSLEIINNGSTANGPFIGPGSTLTGLEISLISPPTTNFRGLAVDVTK